MPTAFHVHLRSPPRNDHRGVDLISNVLPFGRLWYGGPTAVANTIGYAEHSSRSHYAVIRVYEDAGNVIETHERAGDFKEWEVRFFLVSGDRSLIMSQD
jgi:hypothetical protein